MNKKTLWTIALAGSLLVWSCAYEPKKTEQDTEDVPSELYDDLTYSTHDVSKEWMNNVRYPSKYDDWDKFDENWHLISDKNKAEESPADSLLNEDEDSINIDSVVVDSVETVPTIVDTINSQEVIDWGTADIMQGLWGVKEKTRGEVFITIDDGPWAYTQEIAEELYKRWHRATFFMVGTNITEKRYDAMRKAGEMWHELGNHSYSHPNFRKISFEQAKQQLEKTKQRIEDAWIKPAPYFRFPYWNQFKNKTLFDEYMKSMWYKEVFWDIDTRDWSKSTTKKDLIRCLEKVKPWDVILIHERSYTKDKTIPPMDSVLKSKGLVSVPYHK